MASKKTPSSGLARSGSRISRNLDFSTSEILRIAGILTIIESEKIILEILIVARVCILCAVMSASKVTNFLNTNSKENVS